ncbi:hypothetical protein KR059_010996 [Drosophila kikkawai]|nr:hypothetical protein KR059_010996 [Drosophila kikkawai]
MDCTETLNPAEEPPVTPGNQEADEDIFRVPLPPKPDCPGYAVKSTLSGHKSCITSVKFRPDGQQLVSSSSDTLLMLWDVNTAKFQQSMSGHKVGINDLTWSQGHLLASCSDDKTVRLWDPRLGTCQNTLRGHSLQVFACRFNPSGNLLASCSFDETVRLWDVRTNRALKVVPAHHDPITSLDFNRDGTLFATGSFDGLIRVWDTATCQLLKTLIDGDNAPVGHVKFSPNGRYVLASTLNCTLKLWNFFKAKCLRSYRGHVNEAYCINSNFSITGGIWIVSGSEDKSLCIWKLQNKELVQKADTEGDQVICTDCHPKENVIATGALQNGFTVKLWKSSEDESPPVQS